MAAKTPLQRSQVPVEMTWDLTHIYASPDAWEAEFSALEAQLPAFAAFAGTLDKAATLLECLTLRDETGKIISKLYSWASLKKSENNADPQAQSRYDRIAGLYSRRAAATAFVQPEILSIPADDLARLMSEEDGLKLYAYYFETIERERAHTRSGEVEEVLAQLAETRGASAQTFRMFDNADLKFPDVRDENGELQPLTHGQLQHFSSVERPRRARSGVSRDAPNL